MKLSDSLRIKVKGIKDDVQFPNRLMKERFLKKRLMLNGKVSSIYIYNSMQHPKEVKD